MIFTNYLCAFSRFFVAFRQKSDFAATLLPPKMCLNTGIVEDWWQGGSRF
jgi:hypothetical protein